MKYENAKDIFPEHLLREIQTYASGKLVYIPIAEQKRGWGETSGYKQYLADRNQTIRRRFADGVCIDELADTFYLSPDSIKRIVYVRKEERMLGYQCTLTSAKQFASKGRLEDWIHAYLLSDGHNREFSDGLKMFDRFYLGPMTMPLSLFSRCCGPEETMRWRINKEWFESHVNELQQVILSKADLPPLIVHYLIEDGQTEGTFELNDGNHRLEAYNRLGIKEYPVIVWITEQHEYEQFVKKYGQYFK